MFDLKIEHRDNIEKIIEKLLLMDDAGLALMNRDANTLLTYENMKRIKEEKKVG